MLGAFAQRIEPRWEMLAATVEADSVLILYYLFVSDGRSATCADYFTIKDGKIKSETLVSIRGPLRSGTVGSPDDGQGLTCARDEVSPQAAESESGPMRAGHPLSAR